MTADWTPVFVLPNIPLETAIGCEIAALAPAHDRRVAALKRAHPTFRRFLNRFADNFGEKFEPAVLILNTAAPPIFRDVTALANFRDLSAVTHARAQELRHPRGHRVLSMEKSFVLIVLSFAALATRVLIVNWIGLDARCPGFQSLPMCEFHQHTNRTFDPSLTSISAVSTPTINHQPHRVYRMISSGHVVRADVKSAV
jgi:hypothetical protein